MIQPKPKMKKMFEKLYSQIPYYENLYRFETLPEHLNQQFQNTNLKQFRLSR